MMVPGATPYHATRAIGSDPCCPVGRRSPVAIVPAVLGPFPDIAENIVKTELICLKTPDWRRVYKSVIARQRVIIRIYFFCREVGPVGKAADDAVIISEVVGRRAPGAGRILPLGFRQ